MVHTRESNLYTFGVSTTFGSQYRVSIYPVGWGRIREERVKGNKKERKGKCFYVDESEYLTYERLHWMILLSSSLETI